MRYCNCPKCRNRRRQQNRQSVSRQETSVNINPVSDTSNEASPVSEAEVQLVEAATPQTDFDIDFSLPPEISEERETLDFSLPLDDVTKMEIPSSPDPSYRPIYPNNSRRSDETN